MSTFVTSDLHLGHVNIIKHCNRPFKDIYEMDDTLTTNWNNRIKPKDEVYIIGDFVWEYSVAEAHTRIKRLNGKKYLILGNHDYKWFNEQDWYNLMYPDAKDLKIIRHNHHHITLCHYPMRSWYRAYDEKSVHLHGHAHGQAKPYPKSWDVGVDNNNFTPLTLDEAIEKALSVKGDLIGGD